MAISGSVPPPGHHTKAQHLDSSATIDICSQGNSASCSHCSLPYWLLYLWREDPWRLLLLLWDQRCWRKCFLESHTAKSRNLIVVVYNVWTSLSWNYVSQNPLLLCLWVWVEQEELVWDLEGRNESTAITLWKLLESDMVTEICKGALQNQACPCSPLFHVQFFLPITDTIDQQQPNTYDQIHRW